MADIVSCPHCSGRLRLPDLPAGTRLRCPICREPFSILTHEAPPVPSTEPEAPEPRVEKYRDNLPPTGRSKLPSLSLDDPGRESEAPETEAPATEAPAPKRRSIFSEPDETELGRAERKKKNSGWSWALILPVVIIGLGVIGNLLKQREVPPPPPMPFEDPEELREDLRGALVDLKPVTNNELAAEAKQVLENLGTAISDGDSLAAGDQFDGVRIFDHLVINAQLPGGGRNRAAAGRRMQSTLGATLVRRADVLSWKGVEIRHVRQLSNEDAVVIARLHASTGFLKFRWWLTRRSGSWRIYDYEDLDTAVRMSQEAATGASMVRAGKTVELQRLLTAIQELTRASSLLIQGNVDEGERILKSIENAPWPDSYRSILHFLRASICNHRGQYERAHEHVREARRLNPDMPILDLTEGESFLGEEKFDKALPLLKKYHDLLGDDETICAALGQAYLNLDRSKEAAVQYRKSLDYLPDNFNAFYGLLYSLEENDPHADIAARFAKLSDPQEAFSFFAEDRAENRCIKAIEEMAKAMRKIDPRFADVDFYLSLTKLWQNQGREAATLLESALRLENDAEQRKKLTQQFLEHVANTNAPLEIYHVLPDARVAFQVLAGSLKRRYSTYRLEKLIAAHQKRAPMDPHLPLYEGYVHVQHHDYEKAEQAFQRGIDRKANPLVMAEFRRSRVEARYALGKWLSAWKEIGPREETFRQLANLLLSDQNYDSLEAFLKVVEQQEPDSSALLQARAELLAQQGNTKGAIPVLVRAIKLEPNQVRRNEIHARVLGDVAAFGDPILVYDTVPKGMRDVVLERLLGSLRGERLSDATVELCERHLKSHPDHLVALGSLAWAETERKNWARAAQLYARLWENTPIEDRADVRYPLLRSHYQAGKILEAYQQLDRPDETFSTLVYYLVGDKEANQLEALLRVHRTLAENEADVEMAQSRLHVLREQQKQAVESLKRALELTEDERAKSTYVRTWVRDMLGQGKVLEAYQASPDRRVALQILAQSLFWSEDYDGLKHLLEEAKKDNGKSWEWHYYQGRLLMHNKDLRAALPHLHVADSLAPDDWNWEVRHALNQAWVRSGQVVKRYRELSEKPHRFNVLAQVCKSEKSPGQLGALITLCEKDAPANPQLFYWKLHHAWMSENYAKLVQLAHTASDADRSRVGGYELSRLMVRSLVRLNQPKEALKELAAFRKRRFFAKDLAMLVQAANGNVDGCIQQVKQLMRRRNTQEWLRTFYVDEDLGPILRSDEFAKFRAAFPEPVAPERPETDSEE